MTKSAIDHVRDGLEAAMWVPWSPFRLSGRVVNGAHLVHVDKWIENTGGDSGERPAHREPLAFQPARRRSKGAHRTSVVADRVGS